LPSLKRASPRVQHIGQAKYKADGDRHLIFKSIGVGETLDALSPQMKGILRAEIQASKIVGAFIGTKRALIGYIMKIPGIVSTVEKPGLNYLYGVKNVGRVK